jgi:Mrp family chromosome partitioning ATPase
MQDKYSFALPTITEASACWMVAAPRHGQGASVVCELIAAHAARRLPGRVLLLDLDPSPAAIINRLRPQPSSGAPVPPVGCDTPENIVQAGDFDILSLVPHDRNTDPYPLRDAMDKLRMYLPRLRERYELVIADVPGADTGNIAVSLAPLFDGVILVVDQKRTTAHVARDFQSSLTRSGATIVGAVLNNRRFYLPAWIYDRL